MYFCFTDIMKRDRSLVWVGGAISFIWLGILVPILSLYGDGILPFFNPLNKGNQDFAQYYMGGAIACEKTFHALYPYPHDHIKSNVGWPISSTVKPEYQSIANKRGVEDSFRYILPPPATLLLMPLALLSYSVARWLWVICLGICCWGIGLLSYLMGRRAQVSSRVCLFWWMFWSFSPLMLKTIRTANSTPIVAIMLGLGAWAIFQNKRVLSIIACVVAGLFKGTSLVFTPLLFYLRRWHILLGGGVVVLFINVWMCLWSGTEVYAEFFTSVYPSIKIPDPYMGNQSLYGFIYRIASESTGFPLLVTGLECIYFVLITCLLVRMFVIRRKLEDSFSCYMVSVIAVLGLYLVFRPYCWDHYVLCYLPFWTVAWGYAQRRWEKLCLLGFAGLTWLPLVVIRGGTFISGEPMGSHMLWGQLMLIAVALSHVYFSERDEYETA